MVTFDFGYKSEFLQAKTVFSEFNIFCEILENELKIKVERKNLPKGIKLNKFWQKNRRN